MDMELGGELRHITVNPGKITIGTPGKLGEVYFTFDPEKEQEARARAELAMRLLDYTRQMYNGVIAVPKPVIKTELDGVVVKVGEK